MLQRAHSATSAHLQHALKVGRVVQVQVRDAVDPGVVECVQTVAVGAERLHHAVGGRQHGTRKHRELHLLVLPRAPEMPHQALHVEWET